MFYVSRDLSHLLKLYIFFSNILVSVFTLLDRDLQFFVRLVPVLTLVLNNQVYRHEYSIVKHIQENIHLKELIYNFYTPINILSYFSAQS